MGAPAASAHTLIVRSDPANGGKIAEGRATLTLWFSESIGVAASRFTLRTLEGKPIVATVVPSVASGSRVVEIRTKPLARGSYVLGATVLSLEDGHIANATLVFGAGMRPAAPVASADGFPSASAFVLRWIDLIAIMLAIGALAVVVRVLGATGLYGSVVTHRAQLVGACAACVAVLSGALAPFVQTPGTGRSLGERIGATWETLTATQLGHLQLAREVAFLVAAVAFGLWVARRNRWPRAGVVVATALVFAVALETRVGHASELPRQPDLAWVASAAHLVAAGVWGGGLIVLAVCLIPMMQRDADVRGAILATVWRRFSPMAAVATVVLIATGLYESGRHIPSLASVGSTLYGDAVAVKAGLMTLALVLAGLNTLAVNPSIAARVALVIGRPAGWTPVSSAQFAKIVGLEIAVIVVAVGAAAVLTSVTTSRDLAGAANVTAPRVANVDGLFVTFEGVQVGSSRTRLIVQTRSTVKPERGRVVGVDVRLLGPSAPETPVPLKEIEQGRYQAETPTLAAGHWAASVSVRRAGVAPAVAQVDWTVDALRIEEAQLLETVLTALAGALLAALFVLIVLLRGRPWRRARGVLPVATDPERSS